MHLTTGSTRSTSSSMAGTIRLLQLWQVKLWQVKPDLAGALPSGQWEGSHTGHHTRPHITAGQALASLVSEPEPGESVNGQWGHLLPGVPPGDNYLCYTTKRGHPKPVFEWRSRYWNFLLKLSPDRPSPTIQAPTSDPSTGTTAVCGFPSSSGCSPSLTGSTSSAPAGQ